MISICDTFAQSNLRHWIYIYIYIFLLGLCGVGRRSIYENCKQQQQQQHLRCGYVNITICEYIVNNNNVRRNKNSPIDYFRLNRGETFRGISYAAPAGHYRARIICYVIQEVSYRTDT